MLFEQIMFFIAATGALAGALGVVMLRNPFYSVLSLIGHLVSLAILFLLLQSQFLAAAQVVVYAGRDHGALPVRHGVRGRRRTGRCGAAARRARSGRSACSWRARCSW